ADSLTIDRVQNEVADLDSTQTTIDSTRTTIDSARTIIDSTRTTIDSARTIIDSTRTIIDSTGTIIDSTRTIITDSGSKVKQPPAKVKYEDRIRLELEADSTLRKEAPIPKGGEVDSLLLEAAVAMSKPRQVDSIPTDSLANDTSRTRIIKAYHNV